MLFLGTYIHLLAPVSPKKWKRVIYSFDIGNALSFREIYDGARNETHHLDVIKFKWKGKTKNSCNFFQKQASGKL